MKKVLTVVLVAVMLLVVLWSPRASGAETVTVKMTIGSNKAYVNSKEVALDQPPVIENGRTLVPFRFIGEAIGAQIGWDGTKKEVSYVFGDLSLVLTIGSKVAVVNGVKNNLDVAPKILSGRTMVPVRFISETLGAKVEWDGVKKLVTINSTGKPVINFKPKAEYTMQVNVTSVYGWGMGGRRCLV